MIQLLLHSEFLHVYQQYQQWWGFNQKPYELV